MLDEPISLGTTPVDTDETISLPSPGNGDIPLPPAAAEAATAKTRFSGTVPNRTDPDILGDYLQGRQTDLRKQAAANRDYEMSMERARAVQDLASKKGTGLTQTEVNRVLDSFQPADPRTVIERAYADKYVSSLNTARGYLRDSLLDDARSALGSSFVDERLDEGSDLFAKNQYLYNKAAKASELVKNQSYIGYGADFAKGIFQPYNEVKLRGLIGSALSDVALGDVLATQSSKLYDMSMKDGTFQNTVDKIGEALEKDNPQLAEYWYKSMIGQSEVERKLQNIFTGMMPFDYAGIVKGGAKAVQAAKYKRQVDKAAHDIVEAGMKDPTFSPATVAEGAGDLSEAAVQRVAAGQNPMEKAQNTLLSTWYDDAKQFVSNGGTYLGREALTRLNDFVDKGTSLFKKIGTMNRVERAQESVLSPEANRIRMEQIKRDYTGPANTFADIEGPIREPTSGTDWYKAKLVNYDGTQFADEATARGFANQLGLQNVVIKGDDPERVFLRESDVFEKVYPNQVKIGKGKNARYVDEGPITRKFKDIDITNEGTPSFTSKPTNDKGNVRTDAVTSTGRVIFRDKDGAILPVSIRGEPGMVPYNLKTGKFEKPLQFPEAVIEQQGLGFHIEYWVPLRETDDITRDTLIKTVGGDLIKNAVSTNSATGGESLKNAVLGSWRNSDDTMSVNESAQRKAATYAQANIHLWAKDMARDLEDIRNGRVRYDQFGEEIPAWIVWPKSWLGGKIKNRQMNEEFTRTLNHARETEGFFKNPGELQDWYQRNFKRDPSYQETKAYFNFVKLVEGDRMMMEIAEFRNRGRLGAEQISVRDSKFFDAIKLRDFPNSTNNYVLILGKNGSKDELLYLEGENKDILHEIGKIDTKRVEALREKIKKGEGSIYQIYDESHMPLSGISELAGEGRLIRYVYTDGKVKSQPLDFNHVVRRGGGHFEWDYDWYLKQADVRTQYPTGINNKIGLKNFYVGDVTLMPIKNRAMGNDVAKIINEAHELIKAGNWEGVKPLAQKLGIKYDEFASWYAPGKDAEGKPTRPLLNPREPIHVVPRNKKIIDLNNDLVNRYRIPRKDDPTRSIETLVDKTRSGPENNFKVQYNQERNSSFDLRTIEDIGTQGNPIYAHRPAEMVDPLETMNRAFQRMVNSTFMDDYKLYHVEHWLREAEPYLDATPNQIRANPFAWYEKPEWKSGVEKHIIANFESNKMKGKQLVGIPSKFDNWVHSTSSYLADKFYLEHGPEASRGLINKAGTVAPIWMLNRLTDPVDFMRSVTFNFKLGLMAIPQFLVQAQTHSLIWALEPQHGTMGTYGMLLHGWGSFTDNPRVLEKLDNAASKLALPGSRFRPGEWLEARRELDNSGFAHVAGEYSNLNNQLKTRLILNDFEKGLKLGQFPFRLGEQSTRVTAWYTAFREFREANPTKPITNIERSQILAKADLLTVNMSRASSSNLNHGAFSLTTQFLTYQIKLAELFWGKRLGETPTERNLARARILGFSSLIYGVPNAIGVTGFPFTDTVREHFMDDLGYIPGEKWTSTMINEGLPAWSLAMATGKLPNVGDRFGSQGFQTIKQAMRGDISWVQALGGASVTTFSNFIMAGLDPYWQYTMSWLRDDPADQRFRIKLADTVEPLKEISSWSTASKWIAAINTGKIIAKNEQSVTDVTPLQATLYALTGMQPQEQDDMFINNKMVQGEKDTKKRVLKEFIKDWRRGIEAFNNNDPEQGHQYKTNAISRAKVAGFDNDELAKAMAIGARTQDAIDTSNYQRWMGGNFNERDKRKEYFRRQIDMKAQQ